MLEIAVLICVNKQLSLSFFNTNLMNLLYWEKKEAWMYKFYLDKFRRNKIKVLVSIL